MDKIIVVIIGIILTIILVDSCIDRIDIEKGAEFRGNYEFSIVDKWISHDGESDEYSIKYGTDDGRYEKSVSVGYVTYKRYNIGDYYNTLGVWEYANGDKYVIVDKNGSLEEAKIELTMNLAMKTVFMLMYIITVIEMFTNSNRRQYN